MESTLIDMGFESTAVSSFLLIIKAFALVFLAIILIEAISLYFILKKANQPGWKAFVPVYNIYTLYKISWKTIMFWSILIVSFVVGIISGTLGDESSFANLLSQLSSIYSIVISIIMLHKLSKSFGHGIGFTFGLVFLSPIFYLILAFDNSVYIGQQN